jgi:hypothetical protein
MAKHQQLGGRIGPRVARVVSDAMADHLHKSASVRAAIHSAGLNKFADLIGDEARPGMGPIWRQIAAVPGMPDHLKQLYTFAADGRGEWSTALNLIGASAVGGSGLGTVFNNMLAPYTQHLLAASPALLLPYGTYAQMATARVITPAELYSRGARQGIMTPDLEALLEANWQRPDFTTLLAMLRRKLISIGEFNKQMERQGWEPGMPEIMSALEYELLAPADLALMALRGIITEDEGRAEAARGGVIPEHFDRLVLATGEPPGPESLMMAMRRGFIDQTRFAHGIRQSRIRNEWIDVMDKLRFSPMSVADAINAQIRGYIPETEARSIALQNGLEAEHFDPLLKSAGRPPGHMEMIQLQRRGLVTQAQVDQAVRESDLKDKYVPVVRGLAVHLPPERLLVTMIQHGAIGTKEGLHLLEEIGFTPDIAQAVVKTGAAQRTAGHKAIALGQVTELFEDHAIDKAKAEQLVKDLGYPAEDVPLILQIAELKRHRKWRDQAVSAIRTGYLKGKFTEQEAQGELAAVGLPAAEVTFLMRLWAIERKATRRQLTEAQIIHGMRQSAITPQDADRLLQQLGYDAGDAAFLVRTAGPIPKGA